MKTDFLRPPVVPGTKVFNEATLPPKGQINILIFKNNIPTGIRIRQLSSFTKNGKTKIVSFAGATSK